MSEQEAPKTELRRIRRMLRQLAGMARDASLTGSFEKGARASALQYNSILRHLEQQGEVPGSLFVSLPDDAAFEEVGIAAAQLAAYLADDEEGPGPRHDRPGHPGPRGHLGNHNVIIGMGALREMKELKELKELGQIIRENLPEWMAGRVPSPPPAPEAPEPPQPPDGSGGLTEVESRLAEVGAKLQAVAEQLRRGDLSDEERARLADQLSRLGQEQAQLARRHAVLRERGSGPEGF